MEDKLLVDFKLEDRLVQRLETYRVDRALDKDVLFQEMVTNYLDQQSPRQRQNELDLPKRYDREVLCRFRLHELLKLLEMYKSSAALNAELDLDSNSLICKLESILSSF